MEKKTLNTLCYNATISATSNLQFWPVFMEISVISEFPPPNLEDNIFLCTRHFLYNKIHFVKYLKIILLKLLWKKGP